MTGRKIESARKLLASGIPPKDVAKDLGVPMPTLYRWIPASVRARRPLFPLSQRTLSYQRRAGAEPNLASDCR